MSRSYGKLVRDKIPQMIEERGERPVYKKLNKKELSFRLILKLKEEIDELIQAETKEEIAEEIADVLEVLYAYGKQNSVTKNSIAEKKRVKARERGTFNEAYYLVSVEEPLTEEEEASRLEQRRMVEQMSNPVHSGSKRRMILPNGYTVTIDEDYNLDVSDEGLNNE